MLKLGNGAKGMNETVMQSVDEMKEWLRQIIDRRELYMLYQPIYDIQHHRLYGYEALLRADAKHGLSPLDLFSMAKTCEMTYDLDVYALQIAMSSFPARESKLFLNVLPSTLYHPQFFYDFQRLLHQSDLSGDQILLEINEGEMIANFAPLKKCLQALRQLRVSVVLDDVGSGYSIQMMMELESDMIKIDRFLVEDVDRSEKKQRVIRMIGELVENRMPIIAEGIENVRELETLQKLGIRLGQGYLLGKPSTIA